MTSKIVSLAAFSSLCFSLGCSPQTIQPHQLRKAAPSRQDDTGQIVKLEESKQIIDLTSEYTDAKVRVVNAQQGLYEIFNLSPKQIAKIYPNAKITKNEYFAISYAHQNKNEIGKVINSFKEMTKIYLDESENLADPDACDQSKSQIPSAIVSYLTPENGLGEATIELGESLIVDSKLSQPHKDHPSKLRIAWAIKPPKGSNIKEKVYFGSQVKFTPDAMGLHTLVILVQDERDACVYETGGFIVTGNAPLTTVMPDVSSHSESFSLLRDHKFYHLDELKAPDAWKLATGRGKKIAIIDSGVNYNHPDLRANIFENLNEIPGNAIDDDENGFVDDRHGYDFIYSDEFPFDDQGHGSHVAGLAASPIFGMAPEAQIIPIKGLGVLGGDMATVAGAIYYAVDIGADVINMSLGTYGVPHPVIMEALDYAESNGVIVVAAAGNGHPIFGLPVNTDEMPNYPSALPNDNIIAVAAKARNGRLAPYSNFGTSTVDVVAPGGSHPDNLTSTFLDNPANIHFEEMSGTSMATPIVAGVVAQVLEAQPTFTPILVKYLLMNSGKEDSYLKQKIGSGRYLSPVDALTLLMQ